MSRGKTERKNEPGELFVFWITSFFREWIWEQTRFIMVFRSRLSSRVVFWQFPLPHPCYQASSITLVHKTNKNMSTTFAPHHISRTRKRKWTGDFYSLFKSKGYKWMTASENDFNSKWHQWPGVRQRSTAQTSCGVLQAACSPHHAVTCAHPSPDMIWM